MPTITAKDLRREFPRSPLEELGGYPWLPRLIDKVRAKHAGTLGDYTPFPCGGDRNFLATTGLEADPLEALITSGASDDQVLAWVKEHASPDAPAKLAAYREQQLTPIAADAGQYREWLNEAITELKAARPELDTSKIDNFTRLICVEEGHACPGL